MWYQSGETFQFEIETAVSAEWAEGQRLVRQLRDIPRQAVALVHGGPVGRVTRGPFLTSPLGANFDPRGEVVPQE
jgi:hypothetical protein